MDEFLKQFGKYAQAYGEQWRLNRPELMDAYQAACEEYNRQYKIGPRTFERVFRKNSMVNMHDLQAVMDAVERAFVQILIVKEPKFQLGDRVRKHSGAWWQGVVVGTYTTLQTPIGYCVQMETPTGNGPVQIYPEAALEHVSAQVQDAREPIPQNKETLDQVAAIMMQHGTPAQRAEAIAYAAPSVAVKALPDMPHILKGCVDMLKANGFGSANIVEVAELALSAQVQEGDK